MPGEAHIDSYYAASANPAPSRSALEGDLRADVCVVGGGFTGVSTALHLAERGYQVVLLEANRIGWGASGRNGGQICTAYSSGMEPIRDRLGAGDAKELFDLAEEAKGLLRERIERHKIDCDLASGYFFGAVKPRQLADLRHMYRSWTEDYGYPRLILAETNQEVRDHVGTAAYIGGLLDPGAGHLHPLNYCLGLAAAAEQAGVRLFEDSPVTRIELGPEAQAVTAEGVVRASYLVLCTNAYLGDLVPKMRQKIMPVSTYVAATQPLGANRAKFLIPGDAAVADCNFALNYFRRSADHRLLFGGGVSYTNLMPPNLPGSMRSKMLQVFPDLDDATFDFVWGGKVAITVERTPHFGRLGANVYFAQGFSGHGVALTGLAGKVIAEAVAGDAERFDLFTRLPHTTFPGGRMFRTPSLALAMLWYRMRDLMP